MAAVPTGEGCGSLIRIDMSLTSNCVIVCWCSRDTSFSSLLLCHLKSEENEAWTTKGC